MQIDTVKTRYLMLARSLLYAGLMERNIRIGWHPEAIKAIVEIFAEALQKAAEPSQPGRVYGKDYIDPEDAKRMSKYHLASYPLSTSVHTDQFYPFLELRQPFREWVKENRSVLLLFASLLVGFAVVCYVILH